MAGPPEPSPLASVLGRCCHGLPSSRVTLQTWMSVKTSRAAAGEASARTRLAPTSASAPRASSWPMALCVRVSGSGLPTGTRASECVRRWDYAQEIPLPAFSLQMWTSAWERSTAHPTASASTAMGPSSVSVPPALSAQREAPAARVRSQLVRVHLSAAGGATG